MKYMYIIFKGYFFFQIEKKSEPSNYYCGIVITSLCTSECLDCAKPKFGFKLITVAAKGFISICIIPPRNVAENSV